MRSAGLPARGQRHSECRKLAFPNITCDGEVFYCHPARKLGPFCRSLDEADKHPLLLPSVRGLLPFNLGSVSCSCPLLEQKQLSHLDKVT